MFPFRKDPFPQTCWLPWLLLRRPLAYPTQWGWWGHPWAFIPPTPGVVSLWNGNRTLSLQSPKDTHLVRGVEGWGGWDTAHSQWGGHLLLLKAGPGAESPAVPGVSLWAARVGPELGGKGFLFASCCQSSSQGKSCLHLEKHQKLLL